MVNLQRLVAGCVRDGAAPGAVAVVARRDTVEVAVAGTLDRTGATPMTRDSIFRLASLTKPVTAAAVLMLVQDRRLRLTDPIGRWLPELASPSVVRTPGSPIDDVVPANRPITVFDLLTSQAGWGFASDFSLPAGQALAAVQGDGREVQSFPPVDEWLAALSRVPLLYQPGESWLYDTSSTLQGALVERVTGSFPEFLAERLFAPLGMTDTAFVVPKAKRDRFTSYYKGDELADGPDGQWSAMPAFPMGSGGLVGTADDWVAFGRMLLTDGDGVLTPASVRLMLTDHTTAAHRAIGAMFLDGQGWGMGGAIDSAGRYGWAGGTGTSARVDPAAGTVTLMFTQGAVDGPVTPAWLRDFWGR